MGHLRLHIYAAEQISRRRELCCREGCLPGSVGPLLSVAPTNGTALSVRPKDTGQREENSIYGIKFRFLDATNGSTGKL